MIIGRLPHSCDLSRLWCWKLLLVQLCQWFSGMTFEKALERNWGNWRIRTWGVYQLVLWNQLIKSTNYSWYHLQYSQISYFLLPEIHKRGNLYHQLFNYLVIFEVNFIVDTDKEFFVLIPGMIAIHNTGHTAAGTSTNGIKFKIHGSVFLREQLSRAYLECKPVCACCFGRCKSKA